MNISIWNLRTPLSLIICLAIALGFTVAVPLDHAKLDVPIEVYVKICGGATSPV